MAAIVVLTTLPDARSAAKMARALVESGAAACVNVVPGVRSTYRWKGKLERGREALLLVKAPKKNFPKIARLVRQRHPYELPELLMLPVSGGSPAYLRWLAS